MKHRLLALNLVLLALAGAGLWRFRGEYRRAQDRYRALQAPAPAAVPALPATPAPPPVQPAGFVDAAQKFLFSADRNPNVVVEPPKVKPRPPLPLLFGVMNLGSGPIAIMAAEANARHKSIGLGETVGEFKLVEASGEQITLEWEGEKIRAQVTDLLVKQAPQQAGPGGTPATGGGTVSGAAALNPPGAAPQGSAASVANTTGKGEFNIGAPIEGRPGTFYTGPGDTAPAGTVFQGRRKVVRQTPFGQQTWWEEIRQ